MVQHVFQTEVQQLLHLMVHSLYSEREIFLRELISNASDACDKLRFQALTDHDLAAGTEPAITIRGDKEAGTLTIEDTGIGLTEAEAIAHLGTIAKSGTKEFMAALAEDQKPDAATLIGQFGVGFYSAFMVADKIVVESRAAAASSDEGVRWESIGDGEFTTETIARPQRGTTITLHLKDDAREFAEDIRLRSLIKKYSDFVTYPIRMAKPAADEKDDSAAELEQVNSGQPIWTRSKSDISDEDYADFYKNQLHCWWDESPATRIHVSVEGTMAFTLLLYVPSRRPMDLFDGNKRNGLKLYVRRVFIMDDCEELLPEYLRFVRGVVDSDDLPLNVSREILQENAVVAKLRKQIVKRVLDHLTRLAKSDDAEEQQAFAAIQREFGAVMREGMVNDFENREAIAKLARWQSTWTDQQDADEDGNQPRTGLDAYVERMVDGQEHIYFVTAPSLEAAKASPHLEGYRKKGYEVLYLCEPVDEWVAQHYTSHGDKQLVSVSKGEAELDDDESLAEAKQAYEGFLGFCGEQLADIKEVRLTGRLTDSPCCLVGDAHDMSANMAEMMRRFGQDVPEPQRILELNPEHPLVGKLKDLHASNAADERLGEYVGVLRDQAILAEGGRIKDPASFAKKVQSLMQSALG